jgi:hypothetical protein
VIKMTAQIAKSRARGSFVRRESIPIVLARLETSR